MSHHLAVFGGSFDPFHLGHLHVLTTFDLAEHPDKLLIVPNHQNPLKNRPIASACDRQEMCRLGILNYPNWEVWDWELNQEKPVFTIDSIRQLISQFSTWTITLLIGEDSIRSMPRWHQINELLSLVRVAVVRRDSDGPDIATVLADLPAAWHSRFRVISGPLVPISATAIRAAAAVGKPISEWVPEPVAHYITEQGVYTP